MKKDLTTKIYHGKFNLFSVLLTDRSTHRVITSELVVGTKRSVRAYTKNYLVPQHRELGRKIDVGYKKLTNHNIEYTATPLDRQAT